MCVQGHYPPTCVVIYNTQGQATNITSHWMFFDASNLCRGGGIGFDSYDPYAGERSHQQDTFQAPLHD